MTTDLDPERATPKKKKVLPIGTHIILDINTQDLISSKRLEPEPLLVDICHEAKACRKKEEGEIKGYCF